MNINKREKKEKNKRLLRIYGWTMAYTQLLTRDTYKVVEKKKSLVQKGIGDNVEPCIQVNPIQFSEPQNEN